MTHDKSTLTKEALVKQVESALGHDADGNPIRIDPEAKRVFTAARALPISPLMDPAWMKARRRQKKNEPSRPTGRFRRKLTNNPYALALIAPIRRCPITGVDLPRFFLQDFEVVHHPDPEQKQPWWAPGPLATDQVIPKHIEGRPFAKVDENKINLTKANGETDIPSWDEVTDQPLDSTGDAESTDNALTSSEFAAKLSDNKDSTTASVPAGRTTTEPASEVARPRRAPLTSYVLGRKAVIDVLNEKRKLQGKLLAIRNGMSNLPPKTTTVWRAGMGDVVLKMLRRKAVDALIHRGNRSPGPYYKFIEPCIDWNVIKDVRLRGCVLWMPKETEGSSSQYATFDVEGAKFGAKMAVHNLHWLLGEEEVQRLQDSAEVFRESDILVLRQWRSDSNIQLHQLLWRLQGYLAEAKPLAQISSLCRGPYPCTQMRFTTYESQGAAVRAGETLETRDFGAAGVNLTFGGQLFQLLTLRQAAASCNSYAHRLIASRFSRCCSRNLNPFFFIIIITTRTFTAMNTQDLGHCLGADANGNLTIIKRKNPTPSGYPQSGTPFILKLPDELLEEILSLAEPSVTSRTPKFTNLAAIALVCRRFNRISTCQLYSHVKVSDTESDCTRNEKLLRSFHGNPGLRLHCERLTYASLLVHVRHLHFVLYRRWNDLARDAYRMAMRNTRHLEYVFDKGWLWDDFVSMVRILAQTSATSLRVLQLQCHEMPSSPPRWKSFTDLAGLGTFTTLKLSGPGFCDEVLRYLLEWPAKLERFEFPSMFRTASTLSLSTINALLPAIASHKATLQFADLSFMHPTTVGSFNAAEFANLEELVVSVSSSYPIPSDAHKLLGPRLKKIVLSCIDRTHFEQEQEYAPTDFNEGLVVGISDAASLGFPLETIHLSFVVFRPSDESSILEWMDMEYPWDKVDALARSLRRDTGINLTYDEPDFTRNEFKVAQGVLGAHWNSNDF
ncbi:hypothetical protein G7046_g524 [Stylonectria norvegica]|nr:hypothetical protein G7046_g524 [Stylonectria norvegica]